MKVELSQSMNEKNINDIFELFQNLKISDSFVKDAFITELLSGTDVRIGSDFLVGGQVRLLFSKSTEVELMLISDISLPNDFPISFPKARPVLLKKFTSGLSNQRVVATFPENWRTLKSREYSLYFVNRFAKRSMNSLVGLEGMISGLENLFEIYRDHQLLVELSAKWVTLHEYFHSTGKFPYPNFKKPKSTIFSSAVEELRVDLLSIQWCIKNKMKLLADFIFFERVVRYLRDGKTVNDCDSISSQLALTFLLNNDLISFKNDTAIFHAEAVNAISVLLEMIVQLEEESTELTLASACKEFCLKFHSQEIEKINSILEKSRNRDIENESANKCS